MTMTTENENASLAREALEHAELCSKALDKLAGGPHYRDDVYEALELAKDTLERAAEALNPKVH